MKRYQSITLWILAISLLLLSACSTPYYIAHDFEARTFDHERVAILPIEVLFTGRLPEALTEADLQKIQAAEARAFQISFYNEILRSTKSGRKPIHVTLQHYSRTLDIMEEYGMSIEESFDYNPAELAEMLEVDAVVKARIEKERFLTDLESYGIEMGIRLGEVLSRIPIGPWLPPNATRAKTIRADYTLLDGDDNATLWSIAFDVDADWREPANEIIDGISRRAAKQFPYRR